MTKAHKKHAVTAEQVAEYLRDHPDFFKRHGSLLESMTPPEVEHGGNVVDLQHHMLGRLQSGLKDIRNQYEGLVLSSRDNMSTLYQVHAAVLAVMRARDLEQLLEVVAIDLPAVFNVDAVRIGIESEAAEFYENKMGDNHSGISFLATGLIDVILGKGKSIVVMADAGKGFIAGFDQLFSDCADIVDSAIAVRMRLPSSQRGALLGFGVRIKNHFTPEQGTEMLTFLSQVLEHRLDETLNDSGLAQLI